MQIKIGTTGLGLGIPGTNLGASTGNMARIFFRHGPADKNIRALAVNDMLCGGDKTGAFRLTAFETKWFDLDPKKDSWAYNLWALLRRKARIDAKGVLAGPFGTVDISITVFDKYDHGNELVSRCCIESPFGWQFSDSSVTGIIEESFNSLKQNNTIL